MCLMSDTPLPVDPAVVDKPVRVVVELLSSADVARLEARDEEIRKELLQLRSEVEGLRRSFYELLEVFSDLKRTRQSPKK